MARIETRVKWCTRRHSRAAAVTLGQTYAHYENETKKNYRSMKNKINKLKKNEREWFSNAIIMLCWFFFLFFLRFNTRNHMANTFYSHPPLETTAAVTITTIAEKVRE